ncbi:hypothetical protein CFC21_086080 [Triticum aestivum]|uniref:F-box protein AT5G49610-like beta-propeller domain-containing protein n=2 Tax=Triticum aestivum TaxID=4565 RepID=A0A3B6PGF9_WHEAT|nr:uncharacterized protein LOC123133227 [Triticum aestivum]KAF7082200.1 hypothetical protein CFC21_086080 [Triticum aestivum]
MTTGRGHRVSPAVAAGPLEDDNVLGEILVRLSPEPSSIPRALVCKPWGRIAASADFRRLWRDRHGRPPVVGVFEKRMTTLLFTPGLQAPDRIPRERFSLQVCSEAAWNTWCVLGVRQGRVLIMNWTLREFLIYNPFSGERDRVPFPPDLSLPPDFFDDAYNANGALLWDDEQRPLKLVLVACSGRTRVEARVYSSETGTWGDIISIPEPCRLTSVPATVVGNRLYCWLKRPVNSILEFNLDSQTLALITRPPRANLKSRNCRIIPGEDGAVGLALFLYPAIELWNRNVNSHGVATWVLRKTVILDSIFDLAPSSTGAWRSLVLGYAEDANSILISVYKEMCIRVFTVQLESMQCKRIHGHFLNDLYHPFASFYAAGPSTAQILAPVNNHGGAGGAQHNG